MHLSASTLWAKHYAICTVSYFIYLQNVLFYQGNTEDHVFKNEVDNGYELFSPKINMAGVISGI